MAMISPACNFAGWESVYHDFNRFPIRGTLYRWVSICRVGVKFGHDFAGLLFLPQRICVGKVTPVCNFRGQNFNFLLFHGTGICLVVLSTICFSAEKRYVWL